MSEIKKWLRPVRRWMWWRHLYADLLGYFWLPCPSCGGMFGGHEIGQRTIWISPGRGVCCCKWCDKPETARG